MSTTKKTIKKVSGKAKIGGPGAAKREAAPQHWCWLTYKYYLRESRKVRPHRWWGASRAEPSAPPPCPSPPPPAPGQETPPVGCSDLALFKGIFGNLHKFLSSRSSNLKKIDILVLAQQGFHIQKIIGTLKMNIFWKCANTFLSLQGTIVKKKIYIIFFLHATKIGITVLDGKQLFYYFFLLIFASK